MRRRVNRTNCKQIQNMAMDQNLSSSCLGHATPFDKSFIALAETTKKIQKTFIIRGTKTNGSPFPFFPAWFFWEQTCLVSLEKLKLGENSKAHKLQGRSERRPPGPCPEWW